MPKEKLKSKLKLVDPEPELMPKMDEKADDKLAMLIRSINEMGRKAKSKANESSKKPELEPEPPLVA